MMILLIVSIEVFGAAMLKTLFILLKSLINREFFYSHRMNIVIEVQKMLIMFWGLM